MWCCNRWGYEPFNDGTSQSLETGGWCVKCTGYKKSKIRLLILHFFCLTCCGVPYLFLNWYPQYRAKLGYRRTQLQLADFVLIKDKTSKIAICRVFKEPVRHFEYQLHRFVWKTESNSFELLIGKTGTLLELIETSSGVSEKQREFNLQIYGNNTIKVEVKSYFTLLFKEVLNPFYVFEIMSVILWTFDEYYHYAICVIFLSGFSIMISIIQCRRQSKMLKNMVESVSNEFVTIIDEYGVNQIINSKELVPGDIILIPPQGCSMMCDALLLTGTCIVNESVLTGESVPVTKVPALHVDEYYEPTGNHAKHTLYCGTHVIQTRYYNHDKVTALVVRTATMTAKGQLIRSIIFPKIFGFDFYRDAIKFVVVMFLISSVGVAYSLYLFISRGAGLETVLLRSLDIVTIVVPPALPAAMTVGTIYSQNRLKKVGIFCTSPPRINVAGKVKLVCFDKTGTLTEEGLRVWGVLMSDGHSILEEEEKPCNFPIMSPILHAMASCHSLTKIDGKLCGDPLDLSMFDSTDWDIEEPGNETNRFDQLAPTVVKPRGWQFVNATDETDKINGMDMKVPLEIGIVRQFHFSSNIQCMSVITRTLGARNMTLYTKGAPEKILKMCLPSTIPENISSSLAYYTTAGYRVIAIAYKQLPKTFKWLHSQRVMREQVEYELIFLGLLILQNTLKPQSAPVIKQLQNARIKCLMLTGDNILTAVSVSRNCGLVAPSTPLSQVIVTATAPRTIKLQPLHSSSERTETDASSALVIDGNTWAELSEFFPGLLPQVATRGVVFARMSPQQKAEVVETLQSLDYIVAMVGDGANDCGALKAAHIGISLSTAEASIAAPFTSNTPDVTCVPKLITEGRCALVTNFGLFNFMMLYSLIQFSSVLILYIDAIEIGTIEFLYVDLVITTSLAVVMGRSEPSPRLVPQRPLSSLISLSNLIPLILQVILAVTIQYASLDLLRGEPWFVPVEKLEGDETAVQCWENTAVFLVSCYQYVILAVVYCRGRPHRQPIYSNGLFMGTVTLLVVFNTILLVIPFHEVTNFFELEAFFFNHTLKFRLILLCLVGVNLVISLLIEHALANSNWLKWCLNRIRRKKIFKNKYKIVERQILSSRFWDPLTI
ncbi:polyamine-transporting ATPase 13A3-like isoform X2 [Rhodnius prolixus]|uniref:polyamine-transporting ATPase 13A3-like isoform X2 n=1 Tax=Rhodnius prolixus TaxID=13249 RepID=UPI003D18A182